MGAKRRMTPARATAVLLAGSVLMSCAGREPVEQAAPPDVEQIARELGCGGDEVAVCIDVNCEPEEFQCVPRNDVKRFFKAGEFRHR